MFNKKKVQVKNFQYRKDVYFYVSPSLISGLCHLIAELADVCMVSQKDPCLRAAVNS